MTESRGQSQRAKLKPKEGGESRKNKITQGVGRDGG